MPRISPSLPVLAIGALHLSAGPARPGEGWHPPAFAALPHGWQHWLSDVNLLPWILGAALVIALLLTLLQRDRRHRRTRRQKILGLRNGPRFRVTDALCHAVWKGRRIDEARLARAHEIARDTTGTAFDADQLRRAARRADHRALPRRFRWMRDGLIEDEKMVIFNSATSVLLADGPLTRADRTFLRRLARDLGLGRAELRALARLVDD